MDRKCVANAIRKPAGGFRFIGAYELLWVYFAFMAKLICWYDVRVWFACQEAVARRCGAKKGVPARYLRAEIHCLVGGGGEKHIHGAFGRLERAGLLHWSEEAITFAKSPQEIQADDLSAFWMMVEDLGQPNRKVPVPRRTIRQIARGTRKVVTATMLGHIIRCCYFKKGAYLTEGSCSAAWVARLFGLDERNVKIARKHLRSSGWLLSLEAAGWHRQRYGGRFAVNATWSPKIKKGKGTHPASGELEVYAEKRSPRNELLATKRSPLLILNGNSFGSRNQKPALAADRPSGIFESERERRSNISKSPQAPTMRHVVIEDLRQTSRTLALFDDAVRFGLMKPSDSERLRFVAAAERALAVGTRNPCGFFARVVRSGLWAHLTQGQEDLASRKIKRHLFGNSTPTCSMGGLVRTEAQALSQDAKIVMAVKRVISQNGLDIEPFEALRRERNDWTRDRWDKAEAEMENSRLMGFRAEALGQNNAADLQFS